jgi:hypothetical protein
MGSHSSEKQNDVGQNHVPYAHDFARNDFAQALVSAAVGFTW